MKDDDLRQFMLGCWRESDDGCAHAQEILRSPLANKSALLYDRLLG